MKNFGLIVLLACFTCVLSANENMKEQFKIKAKDVASKCIIDLNLLPTEEQKIRSNDFGNATRNIQCFLDCFNEGTGFSRGGIVQEQLALDVLHGENGLTPEKIKDAIGKCAKLKGADKCDTAYKMLMCFNDNKTRVM